MFLQINGLDFPCQSFSTETMQRSGKGKKVSGEKKQKMVVQKMET